MLIAAKKLYFIVAGIRLIVIILVSKVIGQCIWRHAPRGRHNKGGQHSHTLTCYLIRSCRRVQPQSPLKGSAPVLLHNLFESSYHNLLTPIQPHHLVVKKNCLRVGTMPACELQPMMAFLDYALGRPLNHFFRDSKMCHFLYFTSQKNLIN